jgi:hypothetical protein
MLLLIAKDKKQGQVKNTVCIPKRKKKKSACSKAVINGLAWNYLQAILLNTKNK